MTAQCYCKTVLNYSSYLDLCGMRFRLYQTMAIVEIDSYIDTFPGFGKCALHKVAVSQLKNLFAASSHYI